jgi:hypothetical protein
LEALGQPWEGHPERDWGMRIRFEHGQPTPSLTDRLWLNGLNGFDCIGLGHEGKAAITGQGYT